MTIYCVEESVDANLIIGNTICEYDSSWNGWRALGGFGVRWKVGAM